MASCRDLKADVPFLSKLFQLLLILPATNATSERSFSALCRISIGYSPGWRQLWAYNTREIIMSRVLYAITASKQGYMYFIPW